MTEGKINLDYLVLDDLLEDLRDNPEIYLSPKLGKKKRKHKKKKR